MLATLSAALKAAPVRVEAAFHRLRDALDCRWGWVIAMIWAAIAIWALWVRWSGIMSFALPDTDDNIRMAQVQAWLNGQSWYDLRQYKLDPAAGGFDIHWSRIVDLPIAAIQLIVRPFFGSLIAQKTAASLAPLIPLAVALAGLALLTRRLVAPAAYIIAAALLFVSGTAVMLMFMPLRVDHHGWQLATLVLTLAGVADQKPWRGGLTSGLASALSLAIGLELMVFLAITGAAIVLHWVWDRDEAARLRAYGLSLMLGVTIGYLCFASYANATMRCDALTPVWALTMVAAGFLSVMLSCLTDARWPVRLCVAALGGAILIAGFALAFPQCLGRPEQVSVALDKVWLSNVREAKPLYAQGWRIAWTTAALPLAGVIGSIIAAWRSWGTRAFGAWAPVALVACASLALVFWQTRAGAGAQLMAIPGATWLIWHGVARAMQLKGWPLRIAVSAAVVGLCSGAGALALIKQIPAEPVAKWKIANNRANRLCPTLWAMKPLAQLSPETIFTLVDLGPRIIAVTHHRAIAGPYHRNGAAILDVHRAFGAAPDEARSIMQHHRATLLVICPHMNEATVHRARHPKGFYARLERGEQFAWLEPVPMPADRPLKAWRIK
jgi:hypothetical protein